MFFISPHPFSPTSGDIGVFKGMPIKELNLWCCVNLTGDIGALAGAPIQKLNLRGCTSLTGTYVNQFCLNRRCCLKATLNSGHP